MQICCRLIGEPRGRKDDSRVAFQKPQPRRDVGGVVGTRLIADPKVGAQERRSNLSYQLFRSQSVLREIVPKSPVEAMLRA